MEARSAAPESSVRAVLSYRVPSCVLRACRYLSRLAGKVSARCLVEPLRFVSTLTTAAVTAMQLIAVMLSLFACGHAFHLPRASLRPLACSSPSVGRSAVFMVDDPKVKAAAAAKAKAAADKKKEAAAKEDGGEEEDPAAKAAAEAAEKKKEEEAAAAKKAAAEKAAAEAKAKAEAKAAAELKDALAMFSDASLVLTPKANGNVPASVTERADALRAKGIPDKAIKTALDQLGLEETPYKRDSFGNIIAPLFGQNGKMQYDWAKQKQLDTLSSDVLAPGKVGERQMDGAKPYNP